MAGFSSLYVIGGEGGFAGADGVNPIRLLVLVGDADRQWMEPHYFDTTLKPLGQVRIVVPAGPDNPDSLLDACIAFFPEHFRSCPSLAGVESALRETERLDFDAARHKIPEAWFALREEARPLFQQLPLWRADFVPLGGAHGDG